jgi:hypothetical protein
MIPMPYNNVGYMKKYIVFLCDIGHIKNFGGRVELSNENVMNDKTPKLTRKTFIYNNKEIIKYYNSSREHREYFKNAIIKLFTTSGQELKDKDVIQENSSVVGVRYPNVYRHYRKNDDNERGGKIVHDKYVFKYQHKPTK